MIESRPVLHHSFVIKHKQRTHWSYLSVSRACTLISFLSLGEDFSFDLIWENLIGLNPDVVTLRGTLRGALSNLTKVEYYQDGLPIYSEDNPSASLELDFSLVGSVRDNDCSLEFDGYLYDSYGCITYRQRIVRSTYSKLFIILILNIWGFQFRIENHKSYQ